MPLFVHGAEIWTLLTRRADSLPHHRGQVAFPGGGRESGEDLWQAALRESEEEIGLPTRVVLPLGALDEVSSPAGFRIVPFVGAIPYPFTPQPAAEEIEEVFAVAISTFADPRHSEERDVLINGKRRSLRLFRVGSHLIWGLTARIVENLLVRLGLEAAPG